MALFLQHKTDDIQWAVWKMEESLEMLFSLLPDGRRISCEQELRRFVSDRRKIEWLSVRVLLFTLLREDKQIAYSSEGKPFLTDHSSFISISHTKGYVAVMLSHIAPVGIDIEQYGQRVHRVSRRFVRPDEQVEPYRGDTTWSLLLHWSAKEALFKCMKEPDADLRKIRLSHFVPQEEGSFEARVKDSFQAQELGTEAQQVFTVGYQISPDFVLTWVPLA